MAYTTINKSADHFNTLLYSGNGSARTVTGVGFQPDFFWIKQRSSNQGHLLWNVLKGGNYYQPSSNTAASAADIGTFTAASDGYSLATDGAYNGNSQTYVGWNWKAGGGQGSSNTDGSINTTYTSVNTTAGFSMSQYTGTGSNATVGHGLGVAPKFIIVKCISHVGDWMVYYGDPTDFFKLNEDNATEDLDTVWYDTAPTNSVFSLGSNGDVNTSGRTYIAYCFAEKIGYSKMGTYVGNGNSNGNFLYTGFRPSWFLVKRTAQEAWILTDSQRGFPQSWNYLIPNTNGSEQGGLPYDFVSNGIKFRGTTQNESGSTYAYMIFGQTLVGSNNIPCTAR
tara:strand:- start:28 stop:1038 length:1011 start_codon:yes stop_codon:yes gene_type:complete